ncbi:glucuronyl esterase domain-containing protein [Planctomicrobium sp. SH664]|uniref:glucuronyl esterase domain-containing protein n=1 Tax=Planctomicrobium sp. SH664 TaxID=3448125 RepID=UPI003F5AE8B4
MLRTWSVVAAAACLLPGITAAAPPGFNYDEAKVPPYEIPSALQTLDGQQITTAEEWEQKQRPALLKLFTEQVYGKLPPAPPASAIEYKVVESSDNALDGKAIRKQVEITIAKKEGLPDKKVMLLLYIPKADRPAPAFLGMSFTGNHAAIDDPDVILNENWIRNNPKVKIKNNKASEAARGSGSSRWAIREAIDRGYAVGMIFYGDTEPDRNDGNETGPQPYFFKPGQTELEADEWGAIGAWAWTLSRALDYLEQDPDINAKQVAVLGHSRLGKTSLWAGASDPRFALVISNNSGCSGAALSRRIFGETVGRINSSFPHWFCKNYGQYSDNENAFPGDQHMLLALIAPRPLYVASAELDLWADPKGEFLSAVHADPVYRLLGKPGFGGDSAPQEMPPVDHPLKTGTIGYHVRSGDHDINAYDWAQYLDFADLHFRGKAPASASK